MAQAKSDHDTPIWTAPNLVAIDPGRKTGVAVMVEGDLVETHAVPGDQLEGVVAMVQPLISKALDRTLFIVERQFAARGAAFNPKSLETLFWRRHMWEIVLDIHGARRVRVHPSTWQATELAVAVRDRTIKRSKDTKARALFACRCWWPGRNFTEDEADAALMARWYRNQQLMRGLHR